MPVLHTYVKINRHQLDIDLLSKYTSIKIQIIVIFCSKIIIMNI